METKVAVYARYPWSYLLLYNGTTVLHYLLGGFGIALGYNFSWPAYLLAALYTAFAFVEMYLVMPLQVCPNCVYYRMKDSRCVSGLNLVSRRIAREGDLKHFANRAKGLLCHNNMYIASLAIPVIAMIPALIINFSLLLLAVFLIVMGLLLFRFFVMLPRMVCLHCAAKRECPNAQAMGLSG
jgi:hypothetical protein